MLNISEFAENPRAEAEVPTTIPRDPTVLMEILWTNPASPSASPVTCGAL